jgi:hypothetical protein
MPDSGPQQGPIFLHVGLPKSGTTFLQDMLRQHRAWLRREGLLYPYDDHRDHFFAALDARENHQFVGGVRPQAEGAWPKLVQRATAFDGTVVLSHEILATASRPAARRSREALDDREVHVVVTARDPARQAVADWQEAIKHGRHVNFRGYVRRAGLGKIPPKSPDADAPPARDFAAQRLLDVIDNWAGDLPPERVHIVTVPQASADPGLLWRRFGELLGIADPGRLTPGGEVRHNPRLGVADIELLRRVNTSLDRRLVADEFGAVAKKLYAQTILPSVSRSEAPVLPRGTLRAGRRTGVGVDRRHQVRRLRRPRRARRPAAAPRRRTVAGPLEIPGRHRHRRGGDRRAARRDHRAATGNLPTPAASVHAPQRTPRAAQPRTQPPPPRVGSPAGSYAVTAPAPSAARSTPPPCRAAGTSAPRHRSGSALPYARPGPIRSSRSTTRISTG